MIRTPQAACRQAKTGQGYVARSGRLRRPGRGPKHEDQSNPKTGSATPLAAERFRLIVDGWATFRPSACTPPRRVLEDAVSPSTIKLKWASTIAEIRTCDRKLQGGEIRTQDVGSGSLCRALHSDPELLYNRASRPGVPGNGFPKRPAHAAAGTMLTMATRKENLNGGVRQQDAEDLAAVLLEPAEANPQVRQRLVRMPLSDKPGRLAATSRAVNSGRTLRFMSSPARSGRLAMRSRMKSATAPIRARCFNLHRPVAPRQYARDRLTAARAATNCDRRHRLGHRPLPAWKTT